MRASLFWNVMVKALPAGAARQSVSNAIPEAVRWRSVPLGLHWAGLEAAGDAVGGGVVTEGAVTDGAVDGAEVEIAAGVDPGVPPRNAATATMAVPAMTAREISAHSACPLRGRLHRTMRAPIPT